MTEVKLEPLDSLRADSPEVKQEPREFPFNIVIVKSECDEDAFSVLHQRPTEEKREEPDGEDCGGEAGCSSDPLTQFHLGNEEPKDHSEDSIEGETLAKRSYAMIPPESRVTDRRTFSCSDCNRTFRWKSHLQKHTLAHAEEKPFKCSVCGNGFRRKNKLTLHMATHNRNKPFLCSVCDKVFKLKSYLSRHRELLHNICPVCEERFSDKTTLCEHLQGHVEEGALGPYHLKTKPFNCEECGKKFGWNAELKRHMLVHSGDRPHKCPLCEKCFKDKSHLKQHLRTHTAEGECPVCQKVFKHESDLNRHMRHVHLLCPVCDLGFTDKAELNEHLKTHVEEGPPKPLSCSNPGETFSCDPELKMDRSVHPRERPYTCSVCDKKFNRKQHLTEHLKQLHHICPICEEQFTVETELNSHLPTHAEEREPHSCTFCGKTFKYNSTLQLHLLRHTGERPYRCSVCDKGFMRQSTLCDHMKIHTGDRPFGCTVCEKSFARKAELSCHQAVAHHLCPLCPAKFSDRVHLGEHMQGHVMEGALEPSSVLIKETLRPFSCTECRKSFRSNADLKRHRTVHTDERSFSCSFCQTPFKHKHHVTQHLRVCRKRFQNANDQPEV